MRLHSYTQQAAIITSLIIFLLLFLPFLIPIWYKRSTLNLDFDMAPFPSLAFFSPSLYNDLLHCVRGPQYFALWMHESMAY